MYELRNEKNISQEDLAEVLDCTIYMCRAIGQNTSDNLSYMSKIFNVLLLLLK